MNNRNNASGGMIQLSHYFSTLHQKGMEDRMYNQNNKDRIYENNKDRMYNQNNKDRMYEMDKQYHNMASKENLNPNVNVVVSRARSNNASSSGRNQHHMSKQTQNKSMNNKSKKVIHLSSKKKNTSMGNYQERVLTEEPTPFQAVPGDTPFQAVPDHKPVLIELDLFKHRRSVQDTLTSSTGLTYTATTMTMTTNMINTNTNTNTTTNTKNNNNNNTNNNNNLSSSNPVQMCCNHRKQASYMVKGLPYCKICSVKLITQGYLAIKIEKQDKQEKQENRSQAIDDFIDKLDRIEPLLEHLAGKLCPNQLHSHYEQARGTLQLNYQHICNSLHNQYQQALASLQQHEEANLIRAVQAGERMSQERDSIRFMREDIMCNITHVLDHHAICPAKFRTVMDSFTHELFQLSDRVLVAITPPGIDVPIVQVTTDYQLGLRGYQGLQLDVSGKGGSSVVRQGLQELESMSSSPDRHRPYPEAEGDRLSFGMGDSTRQVRSGQQQKRRQQVVNIGGREQQLKKGNGGVSPTFKQL